MENVKKQYEEIVEKRKKVLEELLPLSENEVVKRYLELTKLEEELSEEEKTLYTKMRKKEFGTCKHLTIYTKVCTDTYEGKTYHEVGCMKCGADTYILNYERKFLSSSEQAMYDYLKSYSNVLFNSKPSVTCDLELAKAIYKKIYEKYPDIDDKTANKYFEIALDNMRNIKVTRERKDSRIKRLGLRKDFYKWQTYTLKDIF